MAGGGGFDADPGVIDGLAGALRSGSSGLEELGGSVPGTPDAGDISADMGSLMSKLVDAAGEFSTGLAAAGDALTQTGEDYFTAEKDNKQHVSRAAGTH
ncbi:MAG: hypothetical protein ACRDQ5_14900 [Sciscionella sp.]